MIISAQQAANAAKAAAQFLTSDIGEEIICRAPRSWELRDVNREKDPIVALTALFNRIAVKAPCVYVAPAPRNRRNAVSQDDLHEPPFDPDILGFGEGYDLERACWASIEAERMLQHLPKRTRIILKRRVEGWTYAEIASQLGVSTPRVQQIFLTTGNALREARRRMDLRVGRMIMDGAQQGA